MDPSGAATNASLLSDNDLKSDQTSHPVSVNSTTRSKISIAISGLAPRPSLPDKHPAFSFRTKPVEPVASPGSRLEEEHLLAEATNDTLDKETGILVSSARDPTVSYPEFQPNITDEDSINEPQPLLETTEDSEADYAQGSHDCADDKVESDIDDWETMDIPELPLTASEHLKRKRLEIYEQSHPKSKIERDLDAAVKRQNALHTPIAESNRGYQMMMKLGYKPGAPLGMSESAITEPIPLLGKINKRGVGSQKPSGKRTEEEVVHEVVKRQMQLDKSIDEFRSRHSAKFTEKKVERQLIAATKICENLDNDKARDRFWKKMNFDDSKPATKAILEAHVMGPDAEMDEFEGLPVSQRLEYAVSYMRKQHFYCFWCKRHFENEWMEGCPGYEEADH